MNGERDSKKSLPPACLDNDDDEDIKLRQHTHIYINESFNINKELFL